MTLPAPAPASPLRCRRWRSRPAWRWWRKLYATPAQNPVRPPAAGAFRRRSTITDAEAARFLLQAQFAVTDTDLAAVKANGYSAWLTASYNQALGQTGVAWLDSRGHNSITSEQRYFWPQFGDFMIWNQLLAGPDQMRKRLAFALVGILRRVLEPDRRLLSAVRHRRVLGCAHRQRLRQFPHAARTHHAQRGHGFLPQHQGKPEGRRQRPAARRELRARGHAALHHRAVRTQCRMARRDSTPTTSPSKPTARATSPISRECSRATTGTFWRMAALSPMWPGTTTTCPTRASPRTRCGSTRLIIRTWR